jgi:hypothetical protein
MVLIVLLVLWGIVLIPPAWQSHAETRRARQADAFRRKLSVLAPAADTPLARRPMDAARPFEAARAHVAVMAPRNVVRLPVAEAQPVEYNTDELVAVAAAAAAESAARRAERARARVDVLRRRQQVLVGLMAAAVVSAASALLVGDARLWTAHGVVVVAFAAYLAGLRRLRLLATERRAKVRYLPAAAPVSASAAVADGRMTAAGGTGPIRTGFRTR